MRFVEIPEKTDPGRDVGTSVDTLLNTRGLYADADGPERAMAVTGQDDAHGIWQFSTDGGADWTTLADLSDASATLLSADGAGQNRIRFLPNPGFDGSASVTFRAWDGSNGIANGSTGIDVSANGGQSAYSGQWVSATIVVGAVNDPPVFAPIGDKMLLAQDSLRFTVSASDPNNVPANRLTLAAEGLPTGAVFDPATGQFSWRPTLSQLGDYQVTFTVVDDGTPSQKASETITIHVAKSLGSPSLLKMCSPRPGKPRRSPDPMRSRGGGPSPPIP